MFESLPKTDTFCRRYNTFILAGGRWQMRAFLLVWIQKKNMFIKYILFDQAFLSLSRYLDKNWSKNMYFNEHDYKVRWDSNSKCDLNIYFCDILCFKCGIVDLKQGTSQ